MQKHHTIITIGFTNLVIGLLVGIISTFVFMSVFGKGVSMTKQHSNQTMQGEVDGMMAELTGKSGTEFDKVFLKQMIVHHRGAIDMAEAALKYAYRDEIKYVSKEIIETQTQEIDRMETWQDLWYGTSTTSSISQ